MDHAVHEFCGKERGYDNGIWSCKNDSSDSVALWCAVKTKTDIVIGKAVSSGVLSFRGAHLTVNCFIGMPTP